MKKSAEIPSAGVQPTRPPLQEQDWVLQEAVDLANRVEGFGLAVTLTVRGGVITGFLIGAKEFYTKYGALWRQGLGDTEAGRAVEERWVEFGVKTHETFTSPPLDQAPVPPPQYIHLREARYVMGNAIIPSASGMLWRGRLAEVVGFSIGILSTAA